MAMMPTKQSIKETLEDTCWYIENYSPEGPVDIVNALEELNDTKASSIKIHGSPMNKSRIVVDYTPGEMSFERSSAMNNQPDRRQVYTKEKYILEWLEKYIEQHHSELRVNSEGRDLTITTKENSRGDNEFMASSDALDGIIRKGVYVKVESFYCANGGVFAVLKSTGEGPDEVEITVKDLVEEIESGRLVQRDYSSQMHD